MKDKILKQFVDGLNLKVERNIEQIHRLDDSVRSIQEEKDKLLKQNTEILETLNKINVRFSNT